jgi:hypothetical protein
VETGKEMAVLRGHKGDVNAVISVVLPNGLVRIVSGSADKTIRTWEPNLVIHRLRSALQIGNVQAISQAIAYAEEEELVGDAWWLLSQAKAKKAELRKQEIENTLRAHLEGDDLESLETAVALVPFDRGVDVTDPDLIKKPTKAYRHLLEEASCTQANIDALEASMEMQSFRPIDPELVQKAHAKHHAFLKKQEEAPLHEALADDHMTMAELQSVISAAKGKAIIDEKLPDQVRNKLELLKATAAPRLRDANTVEEVKDAIAFAREAGTDIALIHAAESRLPRMRARLALETALKEAEEARQKIEQGGANAAAEAGKLSAFDVLMAAIERAAECDVDVETMAGARREFREIMPTMEELELLEQPGSPKVGRKSKTMQALPSDIVGAAAKWKQPARFEHQKGANGRNNNRLPTAPAASAVRNASPVSPRIKANN